MSFLSFIGKISNVFLTFFMIILGIGAIILTFTFTPSPSTPLWKNIGTRILYMIFGIILLATSISILTSTFTNKEYAENAGFFNIFNWFWMKWF